MKKKKDNRPLVVICHHEKKDSHLTYSTDLCCLCDETVYYSSYGSNMETIEKIPSKTSDPRTKYLARECLEAIIGSLYDLIHTPIETVYENLEEMVSLEVKEKGRN